MLAPAVYNSADQFTPGGGGGRVERQLGDFSNMKRAHVGNVGNVLLRIR